jgi:hypothetical protein
MALGGRSISGDRQPSFVTGSVYEINGGQTCS